MIPGLTQPPLPGPHGGPALQHHVKPGQPPQPPPCPSLPPSPSKPDACQNFPAASELPQSIQRHKSAAAAPARRSQCSQCSHRRLHAGRSAGPQHVVAAGPATPPGPGPAAPGAGAGRAVGAVEENPPQAVQWPGGRGEAEAGLGEEPQVHQHPQPGARAGHPHLRAGHEPPGGHDQRGGGEDDDGAEGAAWPPTPQRDPLRARLERESPARHGLAQEGLRHPRQEPGPVRLVLGLQLGGSPGGAAEEEDGEAAVPQPPEPGGLRGQQRRLRRRVHDQRLRVRAAEPRHRLRGRLSLHRPGRELHVQPHREGRQVPRLPRGSRGQREGPEEGGGPDRPRLRGHRRQPALLPVLQPGGLLRRELQRGEHQPRRAGRGLRDTEGHQALDHQEQLGRGVGQQGLRPPGPQHEQRLRRGQPGQLPQDVTPRPFPPRFPAFQLGLFPPRLQGQRSRGEFCLSMRNFPWGRGGNPSPSCSGRRDELPPALFSWESFAVPASAFPWIVLSQIREGQSIQGCFRKWVPGQPLPPGILGHRGGGIFPGESTDPSLSTLYPRTIRVFFK